MLTEDMVTTAVCDYLRAEQWEIISRAMGRAAGIDIVAARQGARVEVEAKWAGSSFPGTSNYGKNFTRGNVFTRVREAVLKALRVVTSGQAQSAIALPDNHDRRSGIALVRPALQRLGIIVFWVTENGSVSIEGQLPA
jgi:hypothetical protein